MGDSPTGNAEQAEAVHIPPTEVRLVFGPPVPSRYAHQMFVQAAEHEVVLSFFEVIPPILLGTQEEQLEVLKLGVRAECVARIAIARGKYPEFVQAMQHVLSKLPKDNDVPSKASKVI